jgi:hypothetical protein
MLPALFLALQLPIPLPDAITAWKREIEEASGQNIEIIRIPGDSPPAEDLPVLSRYFAQPDFLRSFDLAQAMTFRYEMAGRGRSLILLNSRRLNSMGNTPEALIAHELGHLWLHSLGFKPPVYTPGPLACAAIHIGDIVQHIHIRREQDRRGIPWRDAYRKDYEQATASLRQETTFQPGDPCFRAQRLSLMIDIRSSFAAHEFPARGEYLSLLARQDPEAEAIAIELLESLEPLLELEPAAYAKSLEASREAVSRLLKTGIDLQLN